MEREEFRKAKEYSFLLLSSRQRSVWEIEQKLSQKGYQEITVDKVIAYLSELHLLDDREFARAWIEGRLRAKPMGSHRLALELRRKGLDAQLIKECLAEYFEGLDEVEIARSLAFKRRKRYKDLAPETIKRRLQNFLLRRGFSYQVISEALNDLWEDTY